MREGGRRMPHSGTWVFSTGGCMREGGGVTQWDLGVLYRWVYDGGGLTHRDLVVIYRWVYEGGRRTSYSGT